MPAELEVVPVDRFDWERLVRRAVDVPKGARFTALVMATFADADGTRVRPGAAQLAELSGAHRVTIQKHLRMLRNAGLITITRRGNRRYEQADEYRLTAPVGVFTMGDSVSVDGPVNVASGLQMKPVDNSPSVAPTLQMNTPADSPYVALASPICSPGDTSYVAPALHHQTTYQPQPEQITSQGDSPPREAAATNPIPGPGHPDYQPKNPALAEYKQQRKAQR